MKDYDEIRFDNEDVLKDVVSIMKKSFGVTYYEVVKIIEPHSVPEITITIKLIPKKERY